MSEEKSRGIYIDNMIYFIIGIVFGIFITYFCIPSKTKEVYIPTKVEVKKPDSIYIIKDSIIYKTKYLKEIQHDTIEKVYTLNDSSTLELFYKLVSE